MEWDLQCNSAVSIAYLKLMYIDPIICPAYVCSLNFKEAMVSGSRSSKWAVMWNTLSTIRGTLNYTCFTIYTSESSLVC